MKKVKKKSDSIFDSLSLLIDGIEGLLFVIPSMIITTIGTLIKLIFLSLISLLTFNKFIKLKDLWSKNYLTSNLKNPWNALITFLFFISLMILV